MSQARRRRRERGLTLIELVLAMTIVSLAGALVYGALGTALRAWQGGFSHGRDELVARIVASRLAGQLRSAVAAPARRDGEAAVAFAAGEHELRFVTLLSGSAPAPGVVSYAIVEEEGRPALHYREYPWPDKAFFGEPVPLREERLPEIQGFAVTVERRPEEETGLPDSGAWKPTEGMPGAVSIEIAAAAGDAEPRRWSLKVPILAEGAP